MYYLGIDIGTSSICGVVYDIAKNKIESINKDNDSDIETPYSWEKIQNPTRILFIVEEIINHFFQKFPLIKGIGIAGQMHGIIYVDSEGNALSSLYTWQDNRGNLIYKNGLTYVQFLRKMTNHFVASGYGIVTHFYNIINNIVPPNASKICTIMDYVVMKLTGTKEPSIDQSNAASLGFYDIKKKIFDNKALKNVGINISFLPIICESATVIGYFNNDVPVYLAVGDNQASFLGSVKNIQNSIHITIGTSSQISIFTDKYIEIETLELRPFLRDGYILVGAGLCGGRSLTVLKSFFENTVKLLTGSSDGNIDFYDVLNTIEYHDDNNESLKVNTFFDGTRKNPLLRGSITNISTYNLTPENIMLGFMKGISQELFEFFKFIPSEVKNEKTILIGSGNAIKKNKMLCRVIERHFNCELILSEYDEEAAFGACIIAIIGDSYK